MPLDRDKIKFILALEKALTRPEILSYMRIQLISNTLIEMNKITEEEINDYLDKSDNPFRAS